ncbi:hypothetical protein J1N35_043871 [Gossypium stocksii]|uniref:Uncharacterized protein n=1 Tax=Gossypium stocksii TaxID=47602 RepID=A0A9D3U831_9ROSI|nr:hypothetical protein J1N35_043871 [Gossypium stocksii]
MKAKNISTVKMAMGSSSSMKGGGGNGGSIKGRMSKDAVRHISRSRDSKLKYFAYQTPSLASPYRLDTLFELRSQCRIGNVTMFRQTAAEKGLKMNM